MDSTRRTLINTLAAQLTLLGIYVRKVVVDCNGTEGTYLLALATTYTSRLADLHNHRATILRAASDIYRSILGPLLA